MIERTKKFWGWGNQDVIVPKSFTANILGLMSMAVGKSFDVKQKSPNIADIRLKPSKIELQSGPNSFITTSDIDRIRHTYGQAFRDVIRALQGDFSSAPDAVAYPKSEEQLQQLITFAHNNSVHLVPYGGGTSVCGGVEYRGKKDQKVISVDLKYINNILEVNKVDLTARIQSGILGPSLEKKLKESGLTLRHFPQSFEFSTLGGWIATRSGGHFATNLTQIDEFVQSVRVVSPQGIIETPAFPNSGAGPNINSLISGSEGILGFITEATMRLQRIPKWKLSQTVLFREFIDGVEACRQLSQSGLFPSNARLVGALEALGMGLGDGSHSVLILGFEFHDIDPSSFMKEAINICERNGGKCKKKRVQLESDEKSEQWKSSFLMAPYLRDELILHGLIVETFETCITWKRFDELYGAIMKELKQYVEELCGSGFITCRFTHLYPDGPAPYFTVMANGLDGDRLEIWDKIKRKASDILLRYNATITHHHAVGRDHQVYYQRENKSGVEVLKSLKNHFDPRGIMNPGVLMTNDPDDQQNLS